VLEEGRLVPVSGPPPGLRLEQLRPGGLAGRLGIHEGDVLTAVDDQRITSIADLLAIPSGPGRRREVVLTISRDGEPKRLAISVAAHAAAREKGIDASSSTR
jgi:S1-C subfamily serine protease